MITIMLYFMLVFLEPRSSLIAEEELKDGLRVLILMDGHFYPGYVTEIEPPDVYGVTIDGERGKRPYIYPREELLQEAVSVS